MQRRTRPGRRKSTPLRWLGWLLLLLVIGGGVLTLLAPTLVTRYIRSYLARAEFREQAETMLSTVTGGEARIDSLKWHDDTVMISELEVKSAHGWDITAHGAHASLDFGAIRNGLWNVQNVGADELMLRPSSAPAATELSATAGGGENEPVPAGLISSFFHSHIPSKAEISGSDVERFSFEQGGWLISESRLHAGAWSSGKTALSFKLAGGTLQIPLLLPEQKQPLKLTIDKATLRATEGQLQLSDASLLWKESATATLRGSMKLGPGSWQTTAHVQSVPVAEFLSAYWKQRLSGTLKGDIEFSGSTEGTPATAWKTDAILENGVLQGLPLLDTLAGYTRAERFKRLVLDICQASVRPQGDALHVHNIIVQSNGLLRIEGTLTIRGPALEGELMVGVTPETLRWIPGAQNRVFVESHPKGPPGLQWTRVRVAGTMDAPQEDLTNRLLGGAGMALVFDTPGQILNQATDALLKPVLGKDGAKIPGQVMQEAGGVLESGVKTGVDLLNNLLPGARAK